MSFSAALTTESHERLVTHLDRDDGQEDICFAVTHGSSGYERDTALIAEPILPHEGERIVHGNVSFESRYFLRAAEHAAAADGGLALLHSHPGGRGWQDMSDDDVAAESGIAAQTMALTGRALTGLTLATGSASWSARRWHRADRKTYERQDAGTVRVIGDHLLTTFHPKLEPAPKLDGRLVRTISAWGSEVQATLARLRFGVVGAGSVGALVAESLARIGASHLSIFDFDSIKEHNLDRLLHASVNDVGKAKVARLAEALPLSGTNPGLNVEAHQLSIVEPDGWRRALDCDVLFSCVDRPWPRAALNFAAYGHLIPVIDGGIAVRTKKNRMRSADWRAHVAAPTRPCLECLGQYNPAWVTLERDGLLDDPHYIKGLPSGHPLLTNDNVFGFAMFVAAMEIGQLVSMVAAPGGIADIGSQHYHSVPGTLSITRESCRADCLFSGTLLAAGDDAGFPVSDRHEQAEQARAERERAAESRSVREMSGTSSPGIRQHIRRLLRKLVRPRAR